MSKQIQIMKLGDICVAVKPGLSSYYFKKRDEDGLRIPVVNIKDVREGYIDIDSIDHVDVYVTDAIENSKINSSDIIISTKGSNLRAAVADEKLDGFVFSANLTVLTLSGKVDPEVIAAYLNCPLGQQELDKRAGGSSVKTLNTKQLLEIPVPVPPVEIQKELSRFLKNTREYIQLLSKEAAEWKNVTEATVMRSLKV